MPDLMTIVGLTVPTHPATAADPLMPPPSDAAIVRLVPLLVGLTSFRGIDVAPTVAKSPSLNPAGRVAPPPSAPTLPL